MNGSKAPPDLLVHPSNKQKHRSYCYQFADYCIYRHWIAELSKRYQRSQIKAATSVNSEMLAFYWSLGRDIVEMKAESQWGSRFYDRLSQDLQRAIPNAKGFSSTNLKYMRRFYQLYSNRPQVADQLADALDPGIVAVEDDHREFKFLTAVDSRLQPIDALCNYSCSYLEQGYYLFDSRNVVLDAFGNLFSWDLTQKYMPLNVIKNILSH